MNRLSKYTNAELERRFNNLQTGPISLREVVGFYANDPEDPWNDIDAIEAELVARAQK